MEKILVSGGAGFIGSHLVQKLLKDGRSVRILDSFVPQVHGKKSVKKPFLRNVEMLRGDVRDASVWQKALKGVSKIYHLAAEVGVGQSMYEVTRYVGANTYGTAVLLELLATGRYPVKRMVVASSMSIYGEGAYACKRCGIFAPEIRPDSQLQKHRWEIICPGCGKKGIPQLTPETKPLFPTSIYAITKRDQEEMCLVNGRAYGIPTIALRFFNVYGPGQSLSNPYTGVAAIFSSRLSLGKAPLIFEDGHQSRDFVHVSDIVQACVLAMKRDDVKFGAFNVGTGRATSILEVAQILAREMKVKIQPVIAGKYRAGDIRHCVADISSIRKKLGYRPKVRFENGVRELVKWVRAQEGVKDGVEKATRELLDRKLAR